MREKNTATNSFLDPLPTEKRRGEILLTVRRIFSHDDDIVCCSIGESSEEWKILPTLLSRLTRRRRRRRRHNDLFRALFNRSEKACQLSQKRSVVL